MLERFVVGTVEIEREPGSPHATLKVFTRGALAGSLTVSWSDASEIAKRLLGAAAPGNPIRSDMYAVNPDGSRVEFTPPEEETTEANAAEQLRRLEEAERAKAQMASARRVIRMTVDVEAIGR